MTLKRQVIKEQGIQPKPEKAVSIRIDPRKTIAMLNIELDTGKTIEAWLEEQYSLRQLGKLLGVHHTTIIHWRKKFNNES
jgi:hypothetical protein